MRPYPAERMGLAAAGTPARSHDVDIQASAQSAHVQVLERAARLNPGAGDQDIEPSVLESTRPTRASTAVSSVTSHSRPVTRCPGLRGHLGRGLLAASG